MKKTPLTILSFMLLAGSAHAFDPNALALHLRKTLGLDTRMDLVVSTYTTPTDIESMSMVNVTIQGSPYPVFLSKDESKYIFGGITGDLTIDPDQAHASKINLKGAHSQGSPKAPVTVVVYSDLECSHCKVADEKLKQLYKIYTKDQVRFVFKHFPLNGHPWSEPAAVASECAAQQKESAFWDMNDYFFKNQDMISTSTVRAKSLQAAKSLNLDNASFEKCLKGTAALEKVRADKKEGTAVGVNSTPSIFINGRTVRGFREIDDLKVVIDEKMKDSRK